MLDYDLVIIGGGLVGGSLAAALDGSGLRVCVVEAVAADAPTHPSYDERVIALSMGSRRIFEGIGIWSRIEPTTAPIQHVHVSDRGHFGFAHLDASDEGVPALGYVTPARSIGAALSERLGAADRVELLRPARLIGLKISKERVSLEVAVRGQSRLLSAALLVAADGGSSAVRSRLALPVRERHYGYDAVISTVTPQGIPARTKPGTAFERFTDSGPLAMLPMTEGRYGVVWTSREGETAGIMNLSDEAFIDRLQQRFGERLGTLTRPGRRIAYPLKLVLAKQLTKPRLALIGNAAHTLHPVAGQGFNLGLRDVAELAELLAESQRIGKDLGGEAVLAPYRRRRGRDHAAVAAMTDTLARLFVNDWAPVRAARDLGMLELDVVPGARHLLARHFMGTAGRLPRLARGLALVPPMPAPRPRQSVALKAPNPKPITD